MNHPLERQETIVAPNLAAPQHSPRPLPLFLDLVRSETQADPVRLRRVLEGLRAYQQARRPEPKPPRPAIAGRRGASLRDHGGTGPVLLFVPSLINPPHIADLGDRSLLDWLRERGRRVLLLDWGPVEERRDLSVAGHIEQILLPLLAGIGEPALLAGYCLGGTMALAAAAAAEVRGVALIAAPWHFSLYPDDSRALLARLWAGSREMAAALGVLPMEALQTAFWSLDPRRTVAKFERFAALDPEGPEAARFVALEDWANDGEPVPFPAARELFEDLFAEDRSGRGCWQVAGSPVDPASIACPILNIVSATDRIVPGSAGLGGGERIEIALGHVGMMVGSAAEQSLWQPLDRWVSQVATT